MFKSFTKRHFPSTLFYRGTVAVSRAFTLLTMIVIDLEKNKPGRAFVLYTRMCMCQARPFPCAECCGERSGFARLMKA